MHARTTVRSAYDMAGTHARVYLGMVAAAQMYVVAEMSRERLTDAGSVLASQSP